MSEKQASPIIENISWGEMEVEGLPRGRDMKLWPGGGRGWDWRETDTHHRPGIQIADLKELLEHGAETLVLSRGMQLVLQTAPETLEFLQQEGIEHQIAETREAVQIYNLLAREGKAVGGLFHSTC